MRRFLIAFTLAVAGLSASAVDVGDQFVTARLLHGATIDLPRAWVVLNGPELDAVKTSVGATIDLAGYAKYVRGVETLVSSSFRDPDLYASVTVTAVAIPGITAGMLKTMSGADLQEGDRTIRPPSKPCLRRPAKRCGDGPHFVLSFCRTAATLC